MALPSTVPAELPEWSTWPQVRAYLRTYWQRGQHVAILAPTGTGKTYLWTRGLAPLWSHTLTVDAKPGDPDCAAHARALGAKVVRRYPDPELGRLWGRDPYPAGHYWLAPPLGELREALDHALGQVWLSAKNRRGWVVNVDEVKLVCARRPDGHDLAHHVIRFLRYGRARGITFVGGTQSPRYNGPGMGDLFDQPRWFFIGRTRDARTIERYSDISGLPREVARAVCPSLPPHAWWVIGPEDYQSVTELPGPRALAAGRRRRESARG